MEVHPDPDHALSDGAQSLRFEQFEELMSSYGSLSPPWDAAWQSRGHENKE